MYRIHDLISRLLRPWATLSLKRSGQREVFLTFDDGPHPGNTEQILDKLREAGAKATFFLTGNRAIRNPSLVEHIRADGHSIGSHGMEHIRVTGMSMSGFSADFTESARLLHTKNYRPPYGKISLRQIGWIKKNGGEIIMWNVDLRDYSAAPFSAESTERFIRRIKPGDIILLHDNPNTTASTLFFIDHIISELQQRGVVFSTIE